MCEFESSEISQAVPPSENLPSMLTEKPANGGLMQIGCWSLGSEFDRTEGEIADSLRRVFERFRFRETRSETGFYLHYVAAATPTPWLTTHHNRSR